MTCSTKSLKIFALIMDAIYLLFGIAILSAGIYIIIKLDLFALTAFITIAVGLIVILVAKFGIIGASRESSRLSKSYAVILGILIVLQLLAIAFALMFRTSAFINVDAKFDQLWRNQTIPIRPENTGRIASLEKWLECCGSTSYEDYHIPPYSCYTNNEVLNKEGCRQKFLDYISDRWTAFIICGALLIAVELICAVLAYVLANSIINRWRRSKYYTK